jgi:leucyl aminopeptidase
MIMNKFKQIWLYVAIITLPIYIFAEQALDKENLQVKLSYEITKSDFWQKNTDGFIFLMNEGFENLIDSNTLKTIENKFCNKIRKVLKINNFSGKAGQSFVFTTDINNTLKQLIFVGLGPSTSDWFRNLENLRRAVGQAIPLIKNLFIESSIINFPSSSKYQIDCQELLKQLVCVAKMSEYEFSDFKSNTKNKKVFNATLLVKTPQEANLDQALKHGIIIGDAVNDARRWVETPPNILTAETFSKKIKALSDEIGLECTIFGREKATELGMGGFLGVAQGSDQEEKFVIVEYKFDENAPTVALVGKGVMFDSGGINTKTAGQMEGMKTDMTGAASVFAAIKAIAQIKPNVNVVAIAPLVENMPSGKAMRIDDVLTFMNGKTAEIMHTDAEGRLILADALCYAEQFYKPDTIIDIATLTGAAADALGRFYSIILTKNENLQKSLVELGFLTGDRVWPLPFDEDYQKAIQSNVADICNRAPVRYRAGAIHAACFLKEFVSNPNWVHIDIAGTSDCVPVNYLDKGSSGAGIRLMIEFILNYNK